MKSEKLRHYGMEMPRPTPAERQNDELARLQFLVRKLVLALAKSEKRVELAHAEIGRLKYRNRRAAEAIERQQRRKPRPFQYR